MRPASLKNRRGREPRPAASPVWGADGLGRGRRGKGHPGTGGGGGARPRGRPRPRGSGHTHCRAGAPLTCSSSGVSSGAMSGWGAVVGSIPPPPPPPPGRPNAPGSAGSREQPAAASASPRLSSPRLARSCWSRRGRAAANAASVSSGKSSHNCRSIQGGNPFLFSSLLSPHSPSSPGKKQNKTNKTEVPARS